MANYTINEKSKSISVSRELTATERSIIATYIAVGYKVKEKRNSTAARVNNDDIINYFDSKKDEAGKKEYEEQKNKTIKDKNGKERTAGFLVAMKWFKENHKDAYEKIKEDKKKK